MTGGLMQLVAYGAQDIYLTGNPMITYFKVVYRRHTNFAMETIEQTFSGTVAFGNKVTALVSRNGDLVSGMYLEVALPNLEASSSDDSLTRWTDCVGHYLLNEVSVEIGGQLIDRHYSDWLEIWAQLTIPAGQQSAYYELIGLDGINSGLTQGQTKGEKLHPGANLNSNNQRLLYIPLQFWFCRNVGLSLPLIALQYHEVKVNVAFAQQSELLIAADAPDEDNGGRYAAATNQPSVGSLSASLWVDYVYLDTDERRRFAQVSHEYLIEQLQYNSFTYNTSQVSANLTFNHPVKELIWVCRGSASTAAKQYANYTTTVAKVTGQSYIRPFVTTSAADASDLITYRKGLSENIVQSGMLKLNSQDRFALKEGVYFNRYQPLRHHTNCPASVGINVYSFALKPEDHQPSGTCNFSRIDNAKLILTLNINAGAYTSGSSGIVKVFGVNYNVLRIMSGMGGMAYSN